jgi:prolyl 4-hydroxylase
MLEYTTSEHEYIVHHDFYHKDIETPAGVRVLSFLMYLSDVEEGGETEFPKLGISMYIYLLNC